MVFYSNIYYYRVVFHVLWYRAKAPGAGANKSSGSIIGGRVVAPGGMKVSQKDTDGIHKQGDILIRQLLAEKDEQLNAKDETIEVCVHSFLRSILPSFVLSLIKQHFL